MRHTVYFVASDDLSRVKIGTTVSLTRRLRDLQCASPVPLLLVAEIDGGRTVEAALHARFRAARLHAEWFAQTPELDALIRDIQIAGRRWAAEQLRGQYLIDHKRRSPREAERDLVAFRLVKRGTL